MGKTQSKDKASQEDQRKRSLSAMHAPPTPLFTSNADEPIISNTTKEDKTIKTEKNKDSKMSSSHPVFAKILAGDTTTDEKGVACILRSSLFEMKYCTQCDSPLDFHISHWCACGAVICDRCGHLLRKFHKEKAAKKIHRSKQESQCAAMNCLKSRMKSWRKTEEGKRDASCCEYQPPVQVEKKYRHNTCAKCCSACANYIEETLFSHTSSGSGGAKTSFFHFGKKEESNKPKEANPVTDEEIGGSFVFIQGPDGLESTGKSQSSSSIKNTSNNEEGPPSRFKQRNVDYYVDLLERHPKASGTWVILGDALMSAQSVTVAGVQYTQPECYAKAVELEPTYMPYLNMLALNLPVGSFATIDGIQYDTYALMARIIELRPNSSNAWRNLAITWAKCPPWSCHIPKLHGKDLTKLECIQKAVDLVPDNEIATVVCGLCLSQCADEKIVMNGHAHSKDEILNAWLDNHAKDYTDLEEMVISWFGEQVGNQVLCELSMQLGAHPVVRKFSEQFQFNRQKKLGAGAFGAVYEGKRVRSNGTESPLAVKEVEVESICSPTQVSELKLMTCYRFKEYIVQSVYTTFEKQEPQQQKVLGGETGGTSSNPTTTNSSTTNSSTVANPCHNAPILAHIFMEKAECSLKTYLEKIGHRLHEEEVRLYFAHTLEGLDVLHNYNIVHQDIKPANILLFANGQAKLADFGMATKFSSKNKMTCGKGVYGTIMYAAPEVMHEGQGGPAADIWALACTMLELAHGSFPEPDPAFMDTKKGPPYRPIIPSHLSFELKDLFRRALEMDPKKRSTAKELKALAYFREDVLPESAESVLSFSSSMSELSSSLMYESEEED